jgi:hypothetical protein
MGNQTNGNQFREDETIILDQLRDVKIPVPGTMCESMVLETGSGTLGK